MIRRFAVLAGTLVALVLAGCSSAYHPSGSAMMGGPGETSADAGMMAGAAGYHYSRLTCAVPTSLPGRVVTVTLADMGMTQTMGGTAPAGAHMMLRASPLTMAAGQISVVAQNIGWRIHELVILPLAAGTTAGQRVPGADGKVTEVGSLGEASASCAAGTGDGITAGTVGWTTITLPAGRYELVCNLPNHYIDGMHQEIVLT